MTEREDQVRLGKYLTPLSTWALSFGCAVGWGSFVMPGTRFLPTAGPVGTAIGIFIGAIIMYVIGRNYYYLMNIYPDAGGALTYSARCFGFDHGFFSSWFLILAYVAIIWANASALTLICRNLFGSVLQFGFHYTVLGYEVYLGEVLISLIAILVCGMICTHAKRIAVVIQVLLALVLLGGILFCATAAYLKGGFSVAFEFPFAAISKKTFLTGDMKLKQIFAITALAPWAYVGFESVSNSAEGFQFSVKKTMSIMTAALIASAVSYVLLSFLAASAVPEGMYDWPTYVSHLDELQGVDALPTFYAAKVYLGRIGIVILGFAVTGAVITGLIGNTIAASRLMYTMSKDAILPGWFSKLGHQGTPGNAILFIMLISLFIPFLGRTALGWIVDVNTVGASIAYCYTSAAALYTARKENHKRELITGAIGVLSSVFFFFYFMARISGAMATESYLILTIWSIIGFAYFRVVFAKDEEGRFGKSPIVWIGLASLIFFTSLMWYNGASQKVNEDLSANLKAYYEDYPDAVVDAAATNAFLKDQLRLTDKKLDRNSILELLMMLFTVGLMSSIYIETSRRALKAEHRRMEAELEKERHVAEAKDELLFHVSHDIRTPMNAIMGFTKLASEAKDDPALMQEYLSHVRDSGRQMMSLIDELLEMSNISAGEAQLEPEECDIKAQFDIVLDNLEIQAKEKGVTFIRAVEIDDQLAWADPVRFRRILRNLVDNAIKYTPSGGAVTVSARVSDISHAGYRRYEFTVEDTGIGMTEEFLEKIFESFAQEKTSTESGMSGTGLGLSVVKGLVDLMNGTVRVHSEKNEGSVFYVELPLKMAEEKKEEKTSVAPDNKAEGELRILQVEDIELNRKLCERVLKKSGFLVESVSDGSDAVDLVARMPQGYFDAILMDIQMPVMNGYEATRLIRKMDREDLRTLPIIALSANSRDEDIKRSLEAGMNAHLAKPLDVEKMLDTLKTHIGMEQ